VIDLGANPKYVASIEVLMKTMDTKIQALKKNLKILRINHVQASELQAMQQDKDQLLRQVVQMKDQIEMYEKKIEALKKGIYSS
jgi:SMC interacting uncharacterized protein involved in chromosome segregation